MYTKKQAELLRVFKKGKLKRINILHGSIRSGKTWISLVIWAFWIAIMPKDKSYLMVAKTLTSLKRNCLDLLESLVGENNFQYSLAQKQGFLFGRKIYLEGVNDARAESKIRGMTLQGAYCDELTLFSEDFFAMLLSRLSEKDAKLFGTTNPDRPKHWMKVKYIDRQDELDMFVMEFLIDDNTTLNKEYIEEIKKENTGVFYDRFILGKWVNAEGIIYKEFADNPKKYIVKKEELPTLHTYTIGEDFGKNKSGHAIVLSAIGEDGKLYFLKSTYEKAEGTLVEDIVDWSVRTFEEYFKEYPRSFDVYPDSAESSLINSIRAKSRFSVYPSIKPAIINRIRVENRLFATDRIRFVEGECDVLMDAFSEAMWNSKALKDERLDDGSTNIDILDAAEYSFTYNMDFFERS